MAFKSYDPAKVLIAFGGNQISGFADGTYLEVERNEDTWELVVGADGEATRARKHNRSAKATITLLQSSASNDILSAIQVADEIAGTGVNTLIVKDVLGTTLVSAQSAWIVKPAKISYSNGVESREWVIEMDDVDIFVGGTTRA
jgi:hypothetical protein